MDNLALHGGFATGFGGRVAVARAGEGDARACSSASPSTSTSTSRSPLPRRSSARSSRSPRALQGWHGRRGLLVLDEPTAVLPHDEVERLFAVVEEVRKAGTAVLYVSHRMDEIFQLADRVTILRGGKLVATKDDRGDRPARPGGPDGRRGRRPGLPRAGRRVQPDAPVVLEAAQHRGQAGCAASTSRSTRARSSASPGLAGAGVLELPVRDHGPCAARRQGDRGAAPAAGRRRMARRQRRRGRSTSRSSPPTASARASSTSSPSARTSRCRSSAGSAARASSACARSAQAVEEWSRRLEIKTERPGALISTLSGGNQQKVVVARCLASEPGHPRALRADRGRRHRHPRRDLRPDRAALEGGPDGDRLVVGRGRSARHVHAHRRARETEWSPRSSTATD